ncbi:MAG: hypothetical protein K0R49_628, partial [Burkholderiales bacterium]|nr:hypothetical protein [Burkholderiales bacterium]
MNLAFRTWCLVFLTISGFDIAYAKDQQPDKAALPPFIFGGTYDNASLYRAESLTCMTPGFINNIAGRLQSGNGSAKLGFFTSTSRQSTETTRTTSVTVSIFWGLASETTSYTTSTKTDNYSLSVSYNSDSTKKIRIAGDIPDLKANLNPQAKALYDSIDLAMANQD